MHTIGKLFICAIFLTAGLLACSSQEPPAAPVVAATAIPAPTATPAPVPTATPVPSPTLVPTATPVPELTPTPTLPATESPQSAADDSGRIVPLNLADPEEFLSGLSEAERVCIGAVVNVEQFGMLLAAPDLAQPGELEEVVGCLEDETMLRMAVAGFTMHTGTLSQETSTCVRGGLGEMDLRGMFTASNPEAGMVSGMATFVIGLSCLNDEEWQQVSPALGAGTNERESLDCMVEYFGSPQELAMALQPTSDGPPPAFFQAVQECGMQMPGGP